MRATHLTKPGAAMAAALGVLAACVGAGCRGGGDADAPAATAAARPTAPGTPPPSDAAAIRQVQSDPNMPPEQKAATIYNIQNGRPR